MNDFFRRFAHRISVAVGSPLAFILAAAVILVWIVSGPFFGFSDTWQLVINTSTTIVTFLMVFLIQNAQNRDSKAIHLKLDELLRGVKGARTSMVDLEDLTDEELSKLEREFRELHEHISQHRHTRTGAGQVAEAGGATRDHHAARQTPPPDGGR